MSTVVRKSSFYKPLSSGGTSSPSMRTQHWIKEENAWKWTFKLLLFKTLNFRNDLLFKTSLFKSINVQSQQNQISLWLKTFKIKSHLMNLVLKLGPHHQDDRIHELRQRPVIRAGSEKFNCRFTLMSMIVLMRKRWGWRVRRRWRQKRRSIPVIWHFFYTGKIFGK